MSDYDRGFWEARWSQALREHGDAVAQRPPNAHLIAELAHLRYVRRSGDSARPRRSPGRVSA
jgi:hypothetical protein